MARFERLVATGVGGSSEAVSALISEQSIRSDERGRLSRELHDSTSQLLVALRLKMAGMMRTVTGPSSNEVLSDLYETIEELHREIRAVSAGHDSLAINDGGLPLVLHEMIRRFAAATDMHVTFNLAQPYAIMPRPIEHAVYRITQEALANARRHGSAGSALVRLSSTPEQVQLKIRDDGIGIAKRPIEGCGIRNMRDRAAMLGGELQIKRLRVGTLVELVIPRTMSST